MSGFQSTSWRVGCYGLSTVAENVALGAHSAKTPAGETSDKSTYVE